MIATTNFHTYTNKAAIETANLALRMALLINGGAAVSVLAFIGGLASKERFDVHQLAPVSASLVLFAWGVAAATLALALSYFTNYFMAGIASSKKKIFEHPYLENTPRTNVMWWLNVISHIAAVIAGLGSIICFIIGMLGVRSAITHLM